MLPKLAANPPANVIMIVNLVLEVANFKPIDSETVQKYLINPILGEDDESKESKDIKNKNTDEENSDGDTSEESDLVLEDEASKESEI